MLGCWLLAAGCWLLLLTALRVSLSNCSSVSIDRLSRFLGSPPRLPHSKLETLSGAATRVCVMRLEAILSMLLQAHDQS